MADRFVAQRIECDSDSYEYWLNFYRNFWAGGLPPGRSSFEAEAHEAHENRKRLWGMYEKEGGSYTADLSEAKVIGWRSQKKWRKRKDYRLIPVRIVPNINDCPVPELPEGYRCDGCDCERIT